MGIISKLFGKKNEVEKQELTNVTVKVASTSGIAVSGPEIPSYQGDYAKTIFLWANDKASPVRKADDYARYLLYECGIRDARKYHLEMIKEGYFVEASAKAMFASQTVSELKQILTELEQPTSGKKSILIDRIVDSASAAQIEKYFPQKHYELSEKGQHFLLEHSDYILIHQHRNWGVDWHEYEVHHRPGYSYYDTMWGIFNKRILNIPHNFGRSEYFCMHELCEEEGKRERALEMLLRVLYIDLSGACGLDIFKLYKDGLYTKKRVLELYDVAIMLAPGIVNRIVQYHDIYNDSFVDRLYQQKLPVQVCDKKLFLSIIHSVLNGTYNVESANEQLKTAYKRIVEKL